MKKRSIKITTLIVLSSLFTIAIEAGTFYFSDYILPIYLIPLFLSLLFSHIFLEITFSYEACFLYSTLNIILSTSLTYIIYTYPNKFISYNFSLSIITSLYWFVTIIYCIFRNINDKGPRFVNFNSFFKKMSILFILFYIGIIIYYFFINPINISNYFSQKNYFNFIPFMSIAEHIENKIEYSSLLEPLISTSSKIFACFIPFGFYLKLITKSKGFFTRLSIILSVPLFIEIIQFITQRGYADIDDATVGMIGIVAGIILFNIINNIYHHITGEDFLYNRSPYNFYMRQKF